jgi:hypothetical protein
MAGSQINTRIAVFILPTHPHPGLPLEGEGGSGLILPFRGRTEVGVGRRTEVGMGAVCEQQYSIYPIPIPTFPLKGKEGSALVTNCSKYDKRSH